MSTVTKINRISNNFFEQNLKSSDKELFDSIIKDLQDKKTTLN